MGDIRKVIVNGEEFEIELEQDGENWTATVGGQTFEIKVPDAGPAPKQRRTSGGKSKKSGKVSANIPGKVVTVEVSLGDVVQEGQVVMILEAMKMQNVLRAEQKGTVKGIVAIAGSSLDVYQLILEFE